MLDKDLPFTIYDLTNRRFDELTTFLTDKWLLDSLIGDCVYDSVNLKSKIFNLKSSLFQLV
jgi:hypothetical protein